MRLSILSSVLLLLAFTVCAQPPDLDWVRTFDYGDTVSTMDPHESFLGVRGLDDGGYILCGYTDHGSVEERGLVMRMNVQGEVLWTAEIDRSPNPISWKQRLYDIIPTQDGGFAAVGYSDNAPHEANFVVKFSDTGFQEWMTGSWDRFVKIRERPDGSLAAIEKGSIDGDYRIQTYSADGQLLWTSDIIDGHCYDGEVDPEGNVVVTGRIRFHVDGAEFRMVKLDAQGHTDWARSCWPNQDGVGRDVEITADGNFVACGYHGPLYGYSHTCLIKLDPDGNVLWDRGFPAGSFLTETGDRGFYIVGHDQSDAKIWRATENGSLLWNTLAARDMEVMAMDIALDGGCVLVGNVLDNEGYYDLQMVKFKPEVEIELDPSAQIIPPQGGTISLDISITHTLMRTTTVPAVLSAILPNGAEHQIRSQDLTLSPGNDVSFNGYPLVVPADAPAGTYRIVVKIGDPATGHWLGYGWVGVRKLAAGETTGDGSDGDLSTTDPVASASTSMTVSPNPFNPATTITLTLPQPGEVTVRVLNVLGREVARLHKGTLQQGTHRFVLDGSHLSSGVYLVQVTAGSRTAMRKVILLQ